MGRITWITSLSFASLLVLACGDDAADPVDASTGSDAGSSTSDSGTQTGSDSGNSGSDAGTGPQDAGPPASFTVGAAGGDFTTPDGVVIDVPAGALASEITITVTETPFTDPPFDAASKIYKFEPEGTMFTTPITVSIPYTDPGSPVSFFWTAPGTMNFAEIPNAMFSGGVGTIQIGHFSFSAIGIPFTGACCTEGAQPMCGDAQGTGLPQWSCDMLQGVAHTFVRDGRCPEACITPPTGACCENAGGCSITEAAQCTNGSWAGADTMCPGACNTQGGNACCLGTMCMEVGDEASCLQLDGVYHAGTPCADPDPCIAGG